MASRMKSIRLTTNLLRTQQTTSTHLLQSCLDIATTNKHNAYVTITEKDARAAALSSDKRASKDDLLSPLDGIPIAIKDNFCMQGHPTTAASRMLDTFVSPYDATVVSRLKRAGAVIIGKTNMDEFGMGSASTNSFYGPVTNPCNELHVAGGSSGGSAAAVASGSCYASIGSDTGGSVRQPAAFCGLVGMKPAYGSISRHGLISYASSLDTPGVLARTVEDAQQVMQIIDGGDHLDSTSWRERVLHGSGDSDENGEGDDATDLQGVRVGIPEEYNVQELPDDVIEMWKASLQSLVERGAEVHVVSLPSLKFAVPAYYVLALAEASSNLSRYDGVRYGHRTKTRGEEGEEGEGGEGGEGGEVGEGGEEGEEGGGGEKVVDTSSNAAAELHQQYQASRSEGFGPEVQRRLLAGNFVLSAGAYEKYYGSALRVRERVRSDFNQVFQNVDCLVCPVATSSAPLLSLSNLVDDPVQSYVEDVMTVPASLSGLPSLSIPRGTDLCGMPVGVQVVGPIDYNRPGGFSVNMMRCAFELEVVPLV